MKIIKELLRIYDLYLIHKPKGGRVKQVDYEGLFKYVEKIHNEAQKWSPEKKKYARDNIKAIESTYTGSAWSIKWTNRGQIWKG